MYNANRLANNNTSSPAAGFIYYLWAAIDSTDICVNKLENKGSVTPILIQYRSNWLDMFVVDVNFSSFLIVVRHSVELYSTHC